MTPDRFDFDHTSIGVEDLDHWARFIRRELGGWVLTGQELEGFRYLLFHVGPPTGGGRLELISGLGSDSFMTRFINKFGDSYHHVTFTVPDVEVAAAGIEALGLEIASRQLAHPPWREVFVMPDITHGCMIQIADSTLEFPPLDELAAATRRDVTSYPHNFGGSQHEWWSELWDIAPARNTAVLRTRLASTDPELSRELFGGVLGGQLVPGADGDDVFSWGGPTLQLSGSDRAGIREVVVDGLDAGPICIGSACLGPPV